MSNALTTTQTAALSATPLATALAQREIAQVQARYTLARSFPRSIENFRALLLRECERPSFAEVARYEVPRAGTRIVGPSIRFAEAAHRLYGNIEVEEIALSEDETSRTYAVRCVDQESNASFSQIFVVPKTIEKKKLRDGERAITTRKNSFGETVFLLPASDDEIAMKHAALRSKAFRTVILRMLPGDIVEECERAIVKTLQTKDAEDPDAAKRRMLDSFFELGVSPTMLSEYLGGQPVEGVTPAQLVELRAVYTALRDGEATWPQWMAASPHRAAPAPTEGGLPKDPKAEALREKLAGASKKKAQPKPEQKRAPEPAREPEGPSEGDVDAAVNDYLGGES